jgi:hypothetical protein
MVGSERKSLVKTAPEIGCRFHTQARDVTPEAVFAGEICRHREARVGGRVMGIWKTGEQASLRQTVPTPLWGVG